MKTISIQSFKGGTGKTTATANIAYVLNKYHDKKVLVVEADAQSNISSYFGIDKDREKGIADILIGAVGSRLLKYPFSIKDRIVVTGAKFIYKNNCLKYVILKGFYKLDGNLIPQNFPKRLYNSNCILDYTDDEMILINQLLSEARKYIYGERKQVLLPHINETINTQPAKQNISMIN